MQCAMSEFVRDPMKVANTFGEIFGDDCTRCVC